MSGRHYDPEALETLGRVNCGMLADYYEDLVARANTGGSERDQAFTGALAATWDESFVIFYNCIYETAANIQAFGGALLDIVERNLEDEAAIATAITDAQDQVYADSYSKVEDVEGTPDQAPDSTTLSDNPYEQDLTDVPSGSEAPL